MRAIVALTLCLLLSGCSSNGANDEAASAETTLEFQFAGQGTDRSDTVSVDLSSRPLEPLYESDGEQHPDFFSAHDQLAQWSEETGTPIEVQHSSFGYYLARVDGVPENATTHYWSLSVNGTVSMEGMSSVEMHEGTRVTWTLTAI